MPTPIGRGWGRSCEGVQVCRGSGRFLRGTPDARRLLDLLPGSRTAWQIVDPTIDGVSALPGEDHGVLRRGNQDGDGEGDTLVDFEDGLLAARQLDAVLRHDDTALV